MPGAKRVLVIGESWHGSNCTGFARGFRELGLCVELIGVDEFVPVRYYSFRARALRRLVLPELVRQFNAYILQQARRHRPDIVLVFKGVSVNVETLRQLKEEGAWLVNFYPDVSFTVHRGLSVEGLREYHHIFTSKSFGIADMKNKLGLTNTSLLLHGFDPLVHRPMTNAVSNEFSHDVSFLGTWSPHKTKMLGALRESCLSESQLAIWGASWEKANGSVLEPSLKGFAAAGDYYATAISGSRINLGLLSEIREGATSGDQTTSRTFHIPACRGFLLHERTDELQAVLEEGVEVACFSGVDELVDKVRYYLDHESERRSIAQRGYERCLREHSLAARCREIVSRFPS